MQSSTPFDWGRVVIPLRWAARIVAVAYGGFLGVVALAFMIGEGSPTTLSSNFLPIVLYGILGVGLVIAVFWKGIGEVVGGLAAVAAVAAIVLLQGVGAMLFHLPFVLTGLAFIVCGWYTLAHQHPRVTHASA